MVVKLLEDIYFEKKILDKNSSFLLLKLPSFYKFKIGQVCEVEGLLTEPENFEEFDYRKFWQTKIFFSWITQKYFVRKLRMKGGVIFEKFTGGSKDKINRKNRFCLNEPQSSLLAGILLDRRGCLVGHLKRQLE